MKYCKKCGAEIAEGVSFCEKCGNPVGQVPKQENGKKKWILAISSGLLILAAVIAGGLFATGVIGGKDDAVKTGTNTADVQETPGVTEAAAANTEAPKEDAQKDALNNNSDSEDMAQEAYVAYKAYLKGQEKEHEDDEYYDEYSEQSQFSLIYLDADDYPELIVFRFSPTVDNHFLYTYKNGEVTDTGFTATEVLYMKRQGYIYDSRRHSVGNVCDIVDILKGSYTENVFNADYDTIIEPYNEESDNWDDWERDYWNHLYTAEEVANQCGITGEWAEPVYGENIDEAYTQLLSVGVK